MKTSILFTVLFLMTNYNSFAQDRSDTAQDNRTRALHIFLDCSQCDMEYFKTRFTAVNYVNDSHDADVQILVSSLPTGSGGEEYDIRLYGQGPFKYMKDTIKAVLPEHYSADETRQALLERIRLGLVPFLLKTPYGDKLSLTIEESPLPVEEKDPWKSWVFDISGAGSLSCQKYYNSYSLNGSLYISKITSGIKLESSNNFGLNESNYSYYDSDTLTTYYITQKDLYSQNLFVKSLGNHWGLGGFTSFGRSKYENIDFQMVTGPAVEYNIFSYEEASTREFRILYSVTYEHSKYYYTTIYDKMTDDLFRQDLSINFSYYEPWGTVCATAGGSAYLNDMSQYSLRASAIANVRIFKGLSLSVSGGAGYSQNQRYLREGIPDPSEVLTGQWQLEEGFSYSINVGFSFRFGSKNNNAVNPRFGY